ncbi:MAG: DNAase [Desulfobulbus propionicus]|nr:MAG: DNAase [Desulfobulbus propionicus]
MLIDTHCHIDAAAFAADYPAVLARARAAGVCRLVVPAVARAGWPRLLDLCQREPGCYPALGLHPLYSDVHRDADLDDLQQRSGAGLVAIGEIGLDEYVRVSAEERQWQRYLFEEQLRIAAAAGLPVLLHVRKAHDQVLATLRRLAFPCGGLVHAFNGSLQQALQYVALNFRIGLGGTLTFARSRKIRAVAAALPLSALVLETDAPDLPPAAHRGERNSPEYLPEVLAALAGLRAESAETLARQTTANAMATLSLQRC